MPLPMPGSVPQPPPPAVQSADIIAGDVTEDERARMKAEME